jgi:hypothetical protein
MSRWAVKPSGAILDNRNHDLRLSGLAQPPLGTESEEIAQSGRFSSDDAGGDNKVGKLVAPTIDRSLPRKIITGKAETSNYHKPHRGIVLALAPFYQVELSHIVGLVVGKNAILPFCYFYLLLPMRQVEVHVV